MSEVLQDIQKKLVFPIDFASQRRTDRLVHRTLLFGTISTSLIGFFTQSLFNLMVGFGATVALCMLVALPSYTAYNKQRPEWVKPKIRV
ncbi:LAFA_0B00760g1_1 [Lachancea sp. 'fantastica']|nr:LAFA_0B00760g1_1 [Lachancea sp. 'fantastica']